MKVRPLFVAVVLCLAGLAGCTSGHDLPTISGSPSPSVDLEAVAKAYYDCMTDAGIEMSISANSQGALTIVSFGGGHAVEWQSPDGGAGISMPSNAPAGPIDVDGSQGQEAYLTIDGMDHTEAYLQCLAESGYSDGATIVPVSFDPEQIEHALTITNKWASCARENGFPDIHDAVALPDNSGLTSLHLPYSITEDQLRQLLDACPNFDPDQPGVGTPSAESSAGFLLPQLLFDSPPVTPIDSTTDPESQLAADHVNKLYEIWYEAINTYYENH